MPRQSLDHLFQNFSRDSTLKHMLAEDEPAREWRPEVRERETEEKAENSSTLSPDSIVG